MAAPILPSHLVPIDNDGNGKPDFIIDKSDLRYIACADFAKQIRPLYEKELAGLDPKNPKDLKKITELEKEVVALMNAKVHEQFGDYPSALLEAIKSGKATLADLLKNGMLDEFVRANTDNPLKSSELKNGTLTCKPYSALADDLLKQAGVETKRIVVTQGNYSEDQNGKLEHESSFQHATVISLTTGNIIEFTHPSGKGYIYAHMPKGAPPPTPEQIENGEVIIARGVGGSVIAYQVLKLSQEDIAMVAAMSPEERTKLFTSLETQTLEADPIDIAAVQKKLNEIRKSHGETTHTEPAKGALPDHVKKQATNAVKDIKDNVAPGIAYTMPGHTPLTGRKDASHTV